jgi:hypothetical protein
LLLRSQNMLIISTPFKRHVFGAEFNPVSHMEK